MPLFIGLSEVRRLVVINMSRHERIGDFLSSRIRTPACVSSRRGKELAAGGRNSCIPVSTSTSGSSQRSAAPCRC